MLDVICVGSATVDVFLSTEFSELIKIKNKKKEMDFVAYPTGSKILVKELISTTGGGATNCAVSFARLGLKTGCISKIGIDSNAEFIKAGMKKEGVKDLFVSKKNERTGYSIILDSIEHDRTILAFKGSNNDLKFDELDKKKFKARWFYFSAMLGESFETLKKLAKYAKKKNIKVAFNASQYLARKGKKGLKDILDNCHLLVLNKEEAEFIVKGKNLRELAVNLSKQIPGIVVITNGRHGAIVYDDEFFYEVVTNDVKVIETTGAGDAFASSFLAGLLLKKDIDFAIQLASTNAESVIQHHGAKNKLLSLKEAIKEMKRVPTKVKKSKV